MWTLSCAVMFGAGVFLFDDRRSAPLTPFVPMTSSEISRDRFAQPLNSDATMTLSFVGPEKFAEHKDPVLYDGYSLIYRQPCEVRVLRRPEYRIYARHSTGWAKFHEDLAEVLAHEILHCLRGGWHADWNAIPAAKQRNP